MEIDLPRTAPDRMLRDSLQVPANLRDFLADAFPDAAASLDFTQVRSLEREMIGGDWRAREADLLFEIPYLESPTMTSLVAVLIEHQSDTDALMPLRTLLLLAGYWERVWREWEAKPKPREKFALPPVLSVVLYTADIPWGSNQTLKQLLGPPAALHAFAPEWKPVFWNLAEHTPEQLLAGGPWMQFLAVMRVSAEEMPVIEQIFTEALRRVNKIRDTEHVRWYDLLRMMYYFLVWRSPPDVKQQLDEIVLRENPANQEEVTAMAQTAAEQLMERGAARELKRMLRALLLAKFKQIPESVAQQIDTTNDLEQLREAFSSALTIEKLDDFHL